MLSDRGARFSSLSGELYVLTELLAHLMAEFGLFYTLFDHSFH